MSLTLQSEISNFKFAILFPEICRLRQHFYATYTYKCLTNAHSDNGKLAGKQAGSGRFPDRY